MIWRAVALLFYKKWLFALQILFFKKSINQQFFFSFFKQDTIDFTTRLDSQIFESISCFKLKSEIQAYRNNKECFSFKILFVYHSLLAFQEDFFISPAEGNNPISDVVSLLFWGNDVVPAIF